MQTTLYYEEEDRDDVEFLGEHRAENGRVECVGDQMRAGVLGFGCGVSPVRRAPFFFIMTTYAV